jgi:hypothetical protein
VTPDHGAAPFVFVGIERRDAGLEIFEEKNGNILSKVSNIESNSIQQEDIMRIARFSKPLTIALHPEVFDRVKQITDDERRSMADWVRAAIDRVLNESSTANLVKEDKSNGHGI